MILFWLYKYYRFLLLWCLTALSFISVWTSSQLPLVTISTILRHLVALIRKSNFLHDTEMRRNIVRIRQLFFQPSKATFSQNILFVIISLLIISFVILLRVFKCSGFTLLQSWWMILTNKSSNKILFSSFLEEMFINWLSCNKRLL